MANNDKVNAKMRDGSFGRTLESIVSELKPEATYFYAEHGFRTSLFVVDMKETSQMPQFAEPLFAALGAEVEFFPVMLPQDLAKATPALEAAAKKYA
ncbi:MAG: hypothetical protein JST54_24185 [Deltaproteobacteria bacterium]|nr:hypothetical protein [Deltaproteobacteria bacterium]